MWSGRGPGWRRREVRAGRRRRVKDLGDSSPLAALGVQNDTFELRSKNYDLWTRVAVNRCSFWIPARLRFPNTDPRLSTTAGLDTPVASGNGKQAFAGMTWFLCGFAERVPDRWPAPIFAGAVRPAFSYFPVFQGVVWGAGIFLLSGIRQ